VKTGPRPLARLRVRNKLFAMFAAPNNLVASKGLIAKLDD